MLTLIALLMIIVFIVSLSKRILSVFGALTIIPTIFGVIEALATGKPILDVF